MPRILIFAFCVLQIAIVVQSDGHYSVVAPGTIRSNTDYNVVVSLHQSPEPCAMKIGITGPSFNETKTVELKPMSTETLRFQVPELKTGDYNLTAEGISGMIFKNSTKLNQADTKPSVYVQTDKATYKPGDLVQYRVVFLDENIRPAKIDKPISILINDGSQNRIKQISDVKLNGGVYSGKLQLSEFPILGDWNIEILIDGEKVEMKTFEVAKYVLPKFEVTVETDKDVAIPDGKLRVTVRAKYTYGKSVKGKAVISVKPSYHFYGSNRGPQGNATIDIDGKGYHEFDLEKDLQLNADRSYVPPLKITAIVEEELTGSKQNNTATVNLHTERYKIQGVNAPYTYHPEKPVTITVVVKKIDGSPVQDTKNPIILTVERPRQYIIRDEGMKSEMKPQTHESNLDEHGMATFTFQLPSNDNTSYYSIKANYLDTTAYITSLSKFHEPAAKLDTFKITVNTEKPRLGKNVSIEVQFAEPISSFIYTIVARGKIVKSEKIELPEDRKSYTAKFMPTIEMIPRCAIYIHYINGTNFEFQEENINFEKDFENHIDLEAPLQAKPGEEVTLKVKTDPNSFVGLLGVDQSVLLLKSGNDFEKERIFNDLSRFDTQTPFMRGFGRYPGSMSGLVTLTNANFPYNEHYPPVYALADGIQNDEAVYFVDSTQLENSPEYFDYALYNGPISAPSAVGFGAGGGALDASSGVEPPSIRKEFPENWIFADNMNDGTELSLTKSIPDTITSWIITGFSLNPETGFALTEAPSKIQVFQPFFVSTNLPYSVKRGEVISIPVIIFNYMDNDAEATITMDNSDGEYEFTEATNEIEENPLDKIKSEKTLTIPSNAGKAASFMIRPKKVGPITLKITAIAGAVAGDTIHQTLKVEPEGVTKYMNRAFFVNLAGKTEQSESVNIDLPAGVVPDSTYVELSVVGDLLGPTIKNLDKLVRMPYGCGEQNMVNFVPNILVLRYLESIKKMSPAIEEKAKKFLDIGYQRELTYKHDNGSYSAFGKSDKSGSTWLTAYVMHSFHQAAKYTDIDPKIIAQGLEFLKSVQAENGSYPEIGKVIDFKHSNGNDKGIGLTAFVLLAFLENEESKPQYEESIGKGLKYIADNIDSVNDQYALAISAYAQQLAKSPDTEKTLAKLNNLAKSEGDRKWWSKTTNTPAKDQEDMLPSYFSPQNNDVELTAYVTLALLENESAETVLPIIKWLISKRNSNGGFSSTQDTVVGLQALIRFAEKSGSGSGQMDIEFTADGKEENKGTINVNPDNSLVLQTHVLPNATKKVDFTAKGKGSSMVQVSYRYNMADKVVTPSFKISTKVATPTPDLIKLEICAEYFATNEEQKESNMAVMEINLPSGYTVETENSLDIKDDVIKRTETKNGNSVLIVYIDGLKVGEQKCIPVEGIKTHAVAKQKPSAIVLYDYYDDSKRATEYYDIPSSLCDICKGSDCGAGCAPKKQ